jgi:hypothetical protein
MDADGTNQRLLMQMRAPQNPAYTDWNNNPVWSPDGSKIAIEGHGRIWVANADGTSARVLVERLNAYPYSMYGNPAWTPDSSRLVFSRYSGGNDIWRINADGTDFKRIASSGRAPLFGADTSSLFVVGGSYNSGEILRLQPYADFYGITETNLTRAAGDDSEPSWGQQTSSAPVAQPKSTTLDEDTPTEITPVAIDADNDVLQYGIVDQPQHGTLSRTGEQLRYTPDADFHGTDTFSFRAWDGSAFSNVATVTLTVRPVNDAPVAKGEEFVMFPNEEKTLHLPAPGVLANDTDADGDALYAIILDTSQGLEVTPHADGSFSFTPHNWRSKTYIVSYMVTDGKAFSDPVEMSINVKPRENKDAR